VHIIIFVSGDKELIYTNFCASDGSLHATTETTDVVTYSRSKKWFYFGNLCVVDRSTEFFYIPTGYVGDVLPSQSLGSVLK